MGIREGQLPHIADAMEIFTESWNALPRNLILSCWKKSQFLFEMHASEATSIINWVIDENVDITDLAVGRLQDYSSEDAIDGATVSERLAETFYASLAQYRYLDAARSPLTEILDAVSVIDLRNQLAAVLNSPAPHDSEQSRYESSNQLSDCLFDTYVVENSAPAADKMREERMSENILNNCNDVVVNVTDNPIISSTIPQALGQM